MHCSQIVASVSVLVNADYLVLEPMWEIMYMKHPFSLSPTGTPGQLNTITQKYLNSLQETVWKNNSGRYGSYVTPCCPFKSFIYINVPC